MRIRDWSSDVCSSDLKFDDVAARLDTALVAKKLDEVEAVARERFVNGRQTVKHNRGTDMYEAGNIRFGLELRTQGNDGGLPIHVRTGERRVGKDGVMTGRVLGVEHE